MSFIFNFLSNKYLPFLVAQYFVLRRYPDITFYPEDTLFIPVSKFERSVNQNVFLTSRSKNIVLL